MYRILTEDKNRMSIEDIVNTHFDGFTLIPAIGYWKGQRESSLIIEIETEDVFGVRDVADAIRLVNGQESVLVQRIESQPEFRTNSYSDPVGKECDRPGCF